jgi:hypothetical protein
MTNQEIKEELLKLITDGITIDLTTTTISTGIEHKVHISVWADTKEEFMKLKANADSMTKLLLDNGYKINLDNICIGTQSQHEGIILTKSEEK